MPMLRRSYEHHRVVRWAAVSAFSRSEGGQLMTGITWLFTFLATHCALTVTEPNTPSTSVLSVVRPCMSQSSLRSCPYLPQHSPRSPALWITAATNREHVQCRCVDV